MQHPSTDDALAARVRTSRAGDIMTITLARADADNRLTNAMAASVAQALDAAADARLLVLRADGQDFCIGRDMEPPAPGSRVTAADVLRDDAAPIVALYDALRRRQQPLVGRVQGRAWGIGLVLAAVCDYTLAAQDSTFRLRELERGIPPCIAMAPLLDRMPPKAIGALVYDAQERSADWALAAGLVSQVVPAAQLDTELDALTRRLLDFPAPAVQAVKQYLATAPRGNEAAAVQYGASLLANVLASR
jgi:enoyl-CoA hydratase/carnithine racemase